MINGKINYLYKIIMKKDYSFISKFCSLKLLFSALSIICSKQQKLFLK